MSINQSDQRKMLQQGWLLQTYSLAGGKDYRGTHIQQDKEEYI